MFEYIVFTEFLASIYSTGWIKSSAKWRAAGESRLKRPKSQMSGNARVTQVNENNGYIQWINLRIAS